MVTNVNFPAIPAPDTSPEGLYASTVALKNAVEMLTSQTGSSTGLASASQNDLAALQTQVNSVQTANTWTNKRNPKIGAYTVTAIDDDTTLALGGSAFYTVTLGPASSYDPAFVITILNEDTARAKTVAPDSVTSFLLYPGQSVQIFNQNSKWYVLGRSRWKVTAAKTINVDFGAGNDANDGFATGAGNAKKTVQAAFYQIANEFDYFSSVSSTPLVTILMAANDTQGVHFGPEGLVGAVAGGSITLDGGGHSISCAADTDAAMHMFFGAVLYIQNLTIIPGTSNGGLLLEKGAKAFLKASNVFGASPGGAGGGAQVVIMDSGALEVDANYGISGSAGIHMWCHHNGTLRIPAAVTISITANIAFVWFTIAQTGGVADFTNATISLGAFTVTGKRWEADNLGLVVSNTGAPNTFFPGNANGTTSGGGQGV